MNNDCWWNEVEVAVTNSSCGWEGSRGPEISKQVLFPYTYKFWTSLRLPIYLATSHPRCDKRYFKLPISSRMSFAITTEVVPSSQTRLLLRISEPPQEEIQSPQAMDLSSSSSGERFLSSSSSSGERLSPPTEVTEIQRLLSRIDERLSQLENKLEDMNVDLKLELQLLNQKYNYNTSSIARVVKKLQEHDDLLQRQSSQIDTILAAMALKE